MGLANQKIQIERLNSTNGYTKVDLGPVDIVCSYQYILHLIEPTKIHDMIENFKQTTKLFKNTEIKAIISDELKDIESMLHTLVPHRAKRGLINVGGSIMKWLYGTMDDEDRINVEAHLKIIDENNHNVIDTINQQVAINDNFNRTLNQISRVVQREQAALLARINGI